MATNADIAQTWRARITDGWLPFPEQVLSHLNWVEGDEIAVEACGDVLVLTKVGDNERSVIVRKAPEKKKAAI